MRNDVMWSRIGKFERALVCVVIGVVLLIMCMSETHASNKPVLRIGLMHTFSKSDPLCYDPYGKSLSSAVEMAWNDFQRNKRNVPFETVFEKYDYKENKLLAIKAIESAVSDDSIAAIGYPCSDFALLGGKRAQELKIPVITPTATDDGIASIGRYVWMASFKNSYQGKILAEFAFRELKKRKTIIIAAADCAYCLSLARSYRERFESLDGEIVAEVNILTSETDYSRVIEKVKRYSFDSVLIPNYAMQSAGAIAAFMKNGVRAVFLGGDGWNWSEKTFRIINNPSFEGFMVTSWMPEMPHRKAKEFVSRYKKFYGEDPTGVAAHAYDAAIMIFKALNSLKIYSRENLRNALARIDAHSGVTGVLRYGGKNYPKKSIVVLKLSSNRHQLLKVIDPS